PNLGKVVLYQLSYFRKYLTLLRLDFLFHFLGQGCALPTELFPRFLRKREIFGGASANLRFCLYS
ncbi:MAG: hypothetical protein MJZ73_01720, partial [Bacteroidaceae bacterium]|nr:hypothetical protein [Bacteroidaceae bacterium]